MPVFPALQAGCQFSRISHNNQSYFDGIDVLRTVVEECQCGELAKESDMAVANIYTGIQLVGCETFGDVAHIAEMDSM